MADFGGNLKRLRDRAGLTQEVLATRLKLKRPTPVSLWEGQRRSAIPKARTIKKIAAALGCQPWELLDGVETEYDKLRKDAATATPSVGVKRMFQTSSAGSDLTEGGVSYAASRVLAEELTAISDAHARAIKTIARRLLRSATRQPRQRPNSEDGAHAPRRVRGA
jgi:transcriptional regulator with XRE-family HTH domain